MVNELLQLSGVKLTVQLGLGVVVQIMLIC